MIAGLKRLMRGESNIDFIGRSKLWLVLSLSIVTVAVLGLVFRGLNLGIEFKGGSSLSVPIVSQAGVGEIEDALRDVLPDVDVQVATRSDGGREALVRTRETADKSLREASAALATVAGQVSAGEPDVSKVSSKVVGPSWGRQVSQKALRGLIVFLILVSIYISVRFEPKMAAGALTALFHDLIATAGVYAIVGFEVTPATVIALLTLMGFSLYDTVVVFDRVRENAEAFGSGSRSTYSQMVNRSMNEVLVRSINTSLSSLLPVAGLLFVGVFLFGAVTLKDLALAMFVGTGVSTYSSIFVAAPVLAFLKELEPKNKAIRVRLDREGDKVRVETQAAAAGSTIEGEASGASVPSVRPAGAQPIRSAGGGATARPRGRKRSGKRRR